jgi:hypothetical protein
MNNKYLYNSQKNQKNSKDDIFFKDYQPKLKILNKYLRLEGLKREEKVSKFKDDFIDSTEKPKFFFMRSEKKIENKEFKPSTNLCSSKRSKTYSTLLQKSVVVKGFRNYLDRKMETEILPHNFDDIQSLIELKELKNSLNEKKYLLSNNYYNIKNDINSPNNKTQKDIKLKDKGKKENKKRNIINLIKKFKSDNKKEFTKSIILPKTKNKSHILDKNKKKRPTTAKSIRKISMGLVKQNKMDINNKFKKRLIKSAKSRLLAQKTERESNIIKEKNIKNSFANTSYRNISSYTTTFKSYSKSFGTKNKIIDNKLFKNIEKQVLNPDSVSTFNNKINNIQTEKNEFKSTRQIINRILNDCHIIDKYIRNKGVDKEDNSRKIDKEEILLKLAEQVKKNKVKKLKISVKGKRARIIPDDNIIFEQKLEKIKGIAKKFFRDVYKQILFEKRILNKIEKKNIIDAIEEKQTKKKLFEQIKKEAKEKMIITNDYIVTEEDDKKLLEEQRRLFDFYGNIDGLEWLITKRNIMDYDKRNNNKKVKHKQ